MHSLSILREKIGSLFCPRTEDAAPAPVAPNIPRPMPFYYDEAGDLHADTFRALAQFRKKFNEELCDARTAITDRFAPDSSECRARLAIVLLAHTAFNRTADAIDKELEVMVEVARGIDGIKTMALSQEGKTRA